MKKLFVLFVMVCILSGCFVNKPALTSDIAYSHLSQTSKSEPAKKKEVRPEGVMSEPVLILLGLGSFFMLMSLPASMHEDSKTVAPYFAITTAGLGIILWGAAGITALAED